ncbi:ABC transporter ATP-binding protein [Nitratireductor sp. StC3]|uniref:ABC transporter ATP-binding protein n=1 Tax=Nitratireductor sp. StC3 TaxID=2126741 RepID=UPI0018EC9548|nr:ABC transporter ATP-binding protein [Nitratireductor sp. StC3]
MMNRENMSDPRDDVVLEMRGLRIEGQNDAGWVEIVKGIDLTLKRGEVLGLIGESGAGKSTIGLAALGYARPGCRISGGVSLFDGADLNVLSEDELRRLRGVRIAYVAQSAAASFNPAHRIIDQFVEVATLHGACDAATARQEAVALYRKLRLPDPETIGDRFPHQVSGGQLQRAMVAMAMACRPDLIVFDEPTTALDVTTQIEVLAAIKDVVRDFNTAAIYITHDLAVVAQLADRIMVLRYGELVEEGETRRVLERPNAAYTRELLASGAARRAGSHVGRAILEIGDVSAAYGATKVLHDVSLSVAEGTTVAIVGESGSGKSTLARVVTGLLPCTGGTVRFDGEELKPTLRERSSVLRRRIQLVHQTPDTSLNPRQRVDEILGRPLTFFHGMTGAARKERMVELLDQIELGEAFLQRYPGELSGGQKQRLCIARALAAEPDLIICDEVTSALDQLVARGILKLLMRLQEELRVSYLFITHDIATVRAIADEVVVMHQGRVVEQGPKEEIFVPPHHAYTELLLASVPQMDPDWLDTIRQTRMTPAQS